MPFSRPSLSNLITRIRAGILSRLTSEEMRRSDADVYGRELAGASHELHAHLQFISQNVIYDTATAEYLDRWSSMYLTQPRKAAVVATGFVAFTGANGSLIPALSQIVSAAGDEYQTDVDATIVAGTATAAITSLQPGAAGNALSGTVLSLSTPIAGVNSDVTVGIDGLSGGADQEDDGSLLARLLTRLQLPPQGGASFDYIAWALEVPGVTRAWVYPQELGLGKVTVRFVRDNDANLIPDAGEVTTVQDYIDYRRPVTAEVTVLAPTAVVQNFTIGVTPNTVAVKTAVEAELRDLLSRESIPGGTVLLSHIREAISIAAGENNYNMTVPNADVARATGELTTMGAITWL
ncbi:MAG TPA: baseplate J/gp47 family protein [Methylophilaceae bacterium]|nr:baseplate J/gp47 family protein [Methylophilaceae bacterium]